MITLLATTEYCTQSYRIPTSSIVLVVNSGRCGYTNKQSNESIRHSYKTKILDHIRNRKRICPTHYNVVYIYLQIVTRKVAMFGNCSLDKFYVQRTKKLKICLVINYSQNKFLRIIIKHGVSDNWLTYLPKELQDQVSSLHKQVGNA